MPLLIVLAVFVAEAAVGIGEQEGVFKKTNDTTYIDTVTFEREAAELKEQRAHQEAVRLASVEQDYHKQMLNTPDKKQTDSAQPAIDESEKSYW